MCICILRESVCIIIINVAHAEQRQFSPTGAWKHDDTMSRVGGSDAAAAAAVAFLGSSSCAVGQLLLLFYVVLFKNKFERSSDAYAVR